jgi:hypothetical protein
MLRFLLVLALATGSNALAGDRDADATASCRVEVTAYDRQGRLRPARRVDGTFAPAVVFRGKLAPRDEDTRPLLFDVYNPRGVRYQVLLGVPKLVERERDGKRFAYTTRAREASMAVAGSSIAWTSMYGKWRVEPRIEGDSEPCGRAKYFTIRP